MSRKIKLLWDFRGEDAAATAKHHTVHLKEFAEIEALPLHQMAFNRKLAEIFKSNQVFLSILSLKDL